VVKTVSPAVFDRQGARVSLGARIGAGGEGAIFEVAGRESLVAKLYHRPAGPELAEKLAAMIASKTDRLLGVAAWPTEILHAAQRRVAGFIMPRGVGHDVHLLYSPKSRIANFPASNWSFLLGTAANLARAFAVVHQHGHLVGDINQGNSLISQRATVMLIDCDSFEIHWQGRTFTCGVGTELFLAPELHGQSLSKVIRTRDHDAFSLAVLVFHLLFMGRHPFAGRYRGPGEMTIEGAIREHRFAYGKAASTMQMEPPPCTLPLTALSPEVAALFEQAFSPTAAAGAGRPGPEAWVAGLQALAGQLSTCTREPAHQYFRGLASCPWCQVESCAGIVFFYLVAASTASTGDFDLQRVWERIVAVPPPAELRLPDPATIHCKPSAKSRRAALARLAMLLAAGMSVAAGCVVGLFANVPFILAAGISVLLASFLLQTRWATGWREIKLEATNAREAWKAAKALWKAEVSSTPFEDRRRELGRKRADYLGLAAARRRGLSQLQADARNLQLRRFLDRFRIGSGRISGIGPGRSATLRSYGIETAADITESAVLRVPGFGPALARELFNWRRSVEARFVFNPLRGVEPADIADLDHKLESLRRQIEKDLLSGEGELRQLSAQILMRRSHLLPRLQAAAQRLAMGEADSRAPWPLR
jgi:DNA-binding helix-hairpin-helix protein with protein kinase domain